MKSSSACVFALALVVLVAQPALTIATFELAVPSAVGTQGTCTISTLGNVCGNTDGKCFETFKGVVAATSDCKKSAKCVFGVQPRQNFDGWDALQGNLNWAAGFFCMNQASNGKCKNEVPDGDPSCKTLDNVAIELAGIKCGNSIASILEMDVPGFDLQEEIDKQKIDMPEGYKTQRVKDMCAKHCEVCDESTTATVTVKSSTQTKTQLEAKMAVFNEALCIAFGYQTQASGANAATHVVADVRKLKTDGKTNPNKCPYTSDASAAAASGGRRLASASSTLKMPLSFVADFEKALKPKGFLSKTGAMGPMVTNQFNFTVVVARPAEESSGLGLMGLLIIAVLILLCLICCPICCCIYCCCCKKKGDAAVSAA